MESDYVVRAGEEIELKRVVNPIYFLDGDNIDLEVLVVDVEARAANGVEEVAQGFAVQMEQGKAVWVSSFWLLSETSTQRIVRSLRLAMTCGVSWTSLSAPSASNR